MFYVDAWGDHKSHGIGSISAEGAVKDSACSVVEKYSAYLKDLYQHMVGKSLAPFKLAWVEKNEVEDRRNCDDFTKSTLRGDLDDVVYTKRPFSEGQIGLPSIRTKHEKEVQV